MKKKYQIPVICGAVIILLIIILICCNIFSSPKNKVMLALSKTFGRDSFISIMSGNQNKADNGILSKPYQQDLDDTFLTLSDLTKENVHSEIQFTIEDIQGDSLTEDQLMLKKGGLHKDTVFDREHMQSSSTLDITYTGLNLMSANIYQDETNFYLEVPELLDGYVYTNPETLYNDYNNSTLALFTNSSISSSFDLNYTIENAASLVLPNYKENYTFYAYCNTDNGKMALQQFYEALEVQKSDKEVIINDNSEIKCTNYNLVVPAEAFHSLLKDYYQWRYEDTSVFLEAHPEILGYLSFDEAANSTTPASLSFDEADNSTTSASLQHPASLEGKKNYYLNMLQHQSEQILEQLPTENMIFTLSLDSKNRILKYHYAGLAWLDNAMQDIDISIISNTKQTIFNGELSIHKTSETEFWHFEYSFDSQDTEFSERCYISKLKDDEVQEEYLLTIDYESKDHCVLVNYSENFDEHIYTAVCKGYFKSKPKDKKLNLELTKLNITESNHGVETLYSYSGKLKIEPVEEETIQPINSKTGYELLQLDFFAFLSFMDTLETNWKNTKLYQLTGDF